MFALLGWRLVVVEAYVGGGRSVGLCGCVRCSLWHTSLS